MTDDEIRLFNEIMQNQSGEQTEGLASRYPDVFEKRHAFKSLLIR
jgi:hypothetical protein